MFNLLKVIDLGSSGGTADEVVERLNAVGAKLPGVRNATAGKTLPRALNGGDLMWRVAFAAETDYWACVASPVWRKEIAPVLSADRGVLVDSLAYQADLFEAAAPGDRVSIWRCLAIAVDPGAPAEAIRQFECDTLLMPKYVSSIRSWGLGRVKVSEGRRTWTHLWEQEFPDVVGLEGEYMIHPIHWGLVDGWFDAECPQRIVDTHLIHAAFEIPSPILAC